MEYPASALRAEAEGTSKVLIHFDSAGRATRTELQRASGATQAHARLDEVARATAAQCKLTGSKGAAALSRSVDFVWKLGSAGPPTSQQSIFLRLFFQDQRQQNIKDASLRPSNTTRAELLLKVHGESLRDEVEQCRVSQPRLTAELQLAAQAQSDRAQQAMDALMASHREDLALPVPAALLDRLEAYPVTWRAHLRRATDDAFCDRVVQALQKPTMAEMHANMLLDLNALQGKQAHRP